MLKNYFHYLLKGNKRLSKAHLDVFLYIQKQKFIKWINRLYLKVWPYIFSFWVAVVLVWGTLQFKHDYDLIGNYAHFERYSEGIYVNWRTDGLPGQDPPKK